jgi:hypothetical protein
MHHENMFLKKFRELFFMFLVFRTAVFIMLTGCPVIGFTQVISEISASYEKPSAYIDKVDTIISVKLNVNSEYEQFEVHGSNFYYDIRPNISLSTKISFSYRFISFGIGFKPKIIPGNNDNDMEGKTRTLSFGLNILTSHWMQDLQFGYVTGFYLHNTGDYPPTPDWTKGEDPYIQFPDLKVAVLRGSTGYKLNKNFSLKSISSKTEIQLKSCGSFIPYLVYEYFEIDNQSDDPNQHSSQRTNNFDALASLGYFYTFVIKSKYYASLGLVPGFGFQHTNLLTRLPEENVTTKYTDPLFRLQEKAGIGYNSRKFYTGAELSMAQSSHSQGNTSVQEKATRIFFQVFVGYRFNAPKFLKHETDVVKNMAPTPIQKILE